jgi:hypothetical protein
MTKNIVVLGKEPLDIIARKIAEHAVQADEHVIKAAMLVREARQRVEAGEVGNITWYKWGLKYIKLSPSRLRELQRIAAAEHPYKELERQRRASQKRVEKHRRKNAAEWRAMAKERKQLRIWAEEAPIEDVKWILDRIQRRSHSEDLRRLSLEAA